ncbi:MAG: hypothetical protein Q8870_02525, partial [Sweet potato little leaf phytoplasma]|nr:hypothetical protein [Sweet potato little leaf phytoplasma]
KQHNLNKNTFLHAFTDGRDTSPQSGLSYINNRTVMEMARCLLFGKKLPKKFWAEAVCIAIYLLNRLPTRTVKSKTPYESWSGTKPFAKLLKIFGSICHSFVPSIKRSKLDEKAIN